MFLFFFFAKGKVVPAAALLFLGAFQFVAGWWGHQPGRRAVGGVPPPTISLAVRQIEKCPFFYSESCPLSC